MIPVTPQSGGAGYGYYPNSLQDSRTQGDLLAMLQQLVQHRLGVSTIGANKYRVDPNGLNIGVIDAMGDYRPGF